MSFIAMQCPSCKKEIQVPDDVDTAACMYCGEKIFIQGKQGISGINISNLLGLARTAMAGTNLEEAEKYYTKVLEIDPTISEAWFGKGKSAGWQSTIVNMRLNESIVAFQHAIATCQKDDKEHVTLDCFVEINNLAIDLHTMARTHMEQFVALPDSWTDYLNRTLTIINILEETAKWNPESIQNLENIVFLSKLCIDGIAYLDQFDNNTSKAWQLTPEFEAIMREKMDKTARRIQELIPEYTPPTAEAVKPSACFVVTATLGNENHPTVVQMREFRDKILLQNEYGRHFVTWYHKHGPNMAKFIRNNNLLRIGAYVFIVLPASFVSRFILNISKK